MKKNWYKFILVIVTVILLGWIYLLGRIYFYSKIDDAKKSDAIVVLGASQWNGKPSPVFKARLDQAYDLYEKDFSQKIILTGGVGEGENFSEARSGKIYLSEKGVNKEDMFMEENGRTSKESLDEVNKILKNKNFNSVILVSDGFHIMRLKKMAHDLGIQTYTSPVKNGPINKSGLAQLKYYVRESWVYVLYLVFGI